VTQDPNLSKIEKEFVRLGFTRDTASDAPICRWRYRGLEAAVRSTVFLAAPETPLL
jgi:hypothetical protein